HLANQRFAAHPSSWWQALAGGLSAWYLWGLLSLIVAWLGRRFRVGRANFGRHFFIHLGASLDLALLQLVVAVGVQDLLHAAAGGRGWDRGGEKLRPPPRGRPDAHGADDTRRARSATRPRTVSPHQPVRARQPGPGAGGAAVVPRRRHRHPRRRRPGGLVASLPKQPVGHARLVEPTVPGFPPFESILVVPPLRIGEGDRG